MTYYRKEWKLYVVHFLMKESIRDPYGKLLDESLYIAVELFQFNNPEEAYTHVMEMVQSNMHSDAQHDKDGNIIRQECIGLNNIGLLQTTLDQLKEDLDSEPNYGVTLSTINLAKIDVSLAAAYITKKEELDLFI